MKDQDDWTSYAARASGHGLRKRNNLAQARKDRALQVVRNAGENGICAEDIAKEIKYVEPSKNGGGSVHRLIDSINEQLLKQRSPDRIRPIVRPNKNNRLTKFYRIEQAGRREVHFEKPLKP